MKSKSGEYSLHTVNGVVVEKLSEEAAWEMMLHHDVDPNAKLLFRDKIVACYPRASMSSKLPHSHAPTIPSGQAQIGRSCFGLAPTRRDGKVMQGYIIQCGGDFVNWQGLLAERQYAIVFTKPEEAQAVADIHTWAKVIPHETTAAESNMPQGTYHSYHNGF